LQITRILKRVSVPALACGIAIFGITGGASANKSAHGEQASAKRGTIVAKGSGPNLRYSSTVITKGRPLTIENHTGEGHTLSLVEPQLIPKTNKEIRSCFDKGHICREVAKWHHVHGHTLGQNPARAGGSGWDTEGDLDAKGDSVVFDPSHPPANREVHAGHGAVLHFMCVFHPWMHGTVTVK